MPKYAFPSSAPRVPKPSTAAQLPGSCTRHCYDLGQVDNAGKGPWGEAFQHGKMFEVAAILGIHTDDIYWCRLEKGNGQLPLLAGSFAGSEDTWDFAPTNANHWLKMVEESLPHGNRTSGQPRESMHCKG